ncbi:hypothetical protein NDU88_003402 [Pleurodeles waltl]|uniref:Uncharacterized protein n=1 Tax=Pleurodeles waltl TaxID=8319 RepID=A0AAV7LF84_PLEWA|nr:hypothetical protein NDU88_003402 [Pleurodeles waltl]
MLVGLSLSLQPFILPKFPVVVFIGSPANSPPRFGLSRAPGVPWPLRSSTRQMPRLRRSLNSPLRSWVVRALSAASARHQRSAKDGGRHLGSLADQSRSE